MTLKEAEADYRKGLPREMKKTPAIPKGFSTGGLQSKKKYANPVKFVNNLKK